MQNHRSSLGIVFKTGLQASYLELGNYTVVLMMDPEGVDLPILSLSRFTVSPTP
ncbi:hypothetical protein [Algoriphagus antarcticus]|uniref:hypothetical protein n=1 Tax=Algoriphagus antarcticus TaxID=238540 RepID=UPI00146B29EF|nr:hypothetical protein [Algoriphagus antarcticus]